MKLQVKIGQLSQSNFRNPFEIRVLGFERLSDKVAEERAEQAAIKQAK